MSSAVTYNGEGMAEAGIWSEKFLRIRILEILKETPFFGPSSQRPDSVPYIAP